MRRLILILMLCFGIQSFASEQVDQEVEFVFTLPSDLQKMLDLTHYPSGIQFTLFTSGLLEEDKKMVIYGKNHVAGISEDQFLDISKALKEKLSDVFEAIGEDGDWKVFSLPSLAKEKGSRYRLICKLDEEKGTKFVGDAHLFVQKDHVIVLMCFVITEGCACDLTSYTRAIIETIEMK